MLRNLSIEADWLDESSVLVWAVDAEGRLVYANRAFRELTGAALGEGQHAVWEDFVHPEDAEACFGSMRAGSTAYRPEVRPIRLRRRDGEFRRVATSITPIQDPEVRTALFFGTGHILSEGEDFARTGSCGARFFQAVLHALQELVSTAEPERLLPQLLGEVGGALDSDRCYAFRIYLDEETGIPFASQTHEWCRDGIPPQIDNPALKRLPLSPTYTDFFLLLERGEVIAKLQRDLSGDARELLSSQGVQSVLIAPVFVKGRLWGLLGFDACREARVWTTQEISALRAIACSLGTALARCDDERQLDERDRLLRGLAQATRELISSTDLDHAFSKALALIGEAAKARRVHIFEEVAGSARDSRELRLRALWMKDPTEVQPPATLAYDDRAVGWRSPLTEGLHIRALMSRWSEGGGSGPAEVWSILAAPVVCNGRLWGMVGLEDADPARAWSDSEVDVLKAFSGAIGAAVARHAAEEALRTREAHFRTVIENVTDIIAISDLRGAFTYLSPSVERALGHTPEEMAGREVLTWLHPEDVPKWSGLLASAASPSASILTAELRLRHRNDDWRIFDCAAKPMGATGAQPLLIINARDITERKRAEDALRRSEELLRHSQKMEVVGRLAGSVAHDFNNILTAITGYAELLLADAAGSRGIRNEIEEILKAAERAQSLTRQLLAFSRRQPRAVGRHALNAILLDLMKMLRRLIGEDIELHTELDPDAGFVLVDIDQMHQVVTNLAVNARDAMPDGGRLTLRTARVDLAEPLTVERYEVAPGRYALLEVIDTGRGMDDEVKQHLFEPFFTTKEAGRGTGLGLATVYGIVRQSQGAITVRSSPGCGSVFSIYLPRVEGGAPEVRPTDSPACGRGHETILLVEDEAMLRQLVERLLSRQGYRVLSAAHGEEALVAAESAGGQIDLLLTDLVMPRLNGATLASLLRQKFPELRVLFMSGYASDALQADSETAPGVKFIQKPFKPASLLALIREVLDGR